ncbi:MAG: inorganic phosphate transporter [Acidobacteriota bacterium]
MAELITVAPPPIPTRTAPVERHMPRPGRATMAIFAVCVLGALCFIAVHVARDLEAVRLTTAWPLMLLGLALFIALAFEFVNGFHDTANAVATVIYTNSLQPHTAVILSGLSNLAGVLVSTGAVAYAIVALLPVDLILKISSGAGFSMVFALLIAAILWNLGTWYLGLPASSSHTLVGSILGVGIANQLLNGTRGGSGVAWGEAVKVLEALIFSPIVGFVLAALLLLLAKWLIRYPALYKAPKGNEKPPFPVRALMVINCFGVSFSHGSNDGQKGMGLIMLILIGTVPAAYSINHSLSARDAQQFISASNRAALVLAHYEKPGVQPPADSRTAVTDYIRTGQLAPETIPALAMLIQDGERELRQYHEYKAIPAQDQSRVRNDMYIAGKALDEMHKEHAPAFARGDWAALEKYKAQVDKATKYIPDWVKVAVALALGLGTMVGWKRVVVTVGEKIGKQEMTYAQGASAGLVAMGTIFGATGLGLPVSTTHILASGVAGTMAANGSGLRFKTVRNIAAGWIFTLPAAALLSALLYWLFRLLA